jgi:hypothetical protein
MISNCRTIFLSAFPGSSASRAESDELELMRDDFVAAAGSSRGFEFCQRLQMRVRNLPALNAADMIVILDHAVKALLASAQLELASQTAPTQHFQISVDRSEADSRKSAPNEFVEFAGRGMTAALLQLLQDDSSLPSHPQHRLCDNFSSRWRHNLIIVIILK